MLVAVFKAVSALFCGCGAAVTVVISVIVDVVNTVVTSTEWQSTVREVTNARKRTVVLDSLE